MSVMFELDLHLFGRCKLLSESQRSHAESWNNCTFGQEVFWSNFYLPRGQNLKSSNCKRRILCMTSKTLLAPCTCLGAKKKWHDEKVAYYMWCCTLPNEYFFLAILNANHSAPHKVNVLFLDFEKMQEQEVAYLLKLSVCAKNASEIRPLMQRILNSTVYSDFRQPLCLFLKPLPNKNWKWWVTFLYYPLHA